MSKELAKRAAPNKPASRNETRVNDNAVVIYGLHDYPIWHLPYDEAQRMTGEQLRAEVRHAAGEYNVPQRAIWDALKASR